VFSKPELASIIGRVSSYLVFMNTLIVAQAALSRQRTLRILAAISVATAVLLGSLSIAYIVRGEDSIAYYWVYRIGEVKAYETLVSATPKGIAVLGDVKPLYYMAMTRTVEVKPLLKTILLGKCWKQKTLLVLHRDNYYRNQVVFSTTTIHPLNRIAECTKSLSLVYNNPDVKAWYK